LTETRSSKGRFWLQAMATVPMIDVRVYAKWLKD
jgi:hypothetical protein